MPGAFERMYEISQTTAIAQAGLAAIRQKITRNSHLLDKGMPPIFAIHSPGTGSQQGAPVTGGSPGRAAAARAQDRAAASSVSRVQARS
jgi:hypothetical protein